ncbi:MAG: peptidylprolyl isomerase [Ignavibacteriaceae bacterium]|nr:peptidylprolyl isomerase [Ignavibacteriaceae bacterium]MCU0364505.1 peptidylprolyl isomerase [Ignavibacteriaceae bacterium]MCU0405987.1 peptidylprolyl isomerase [Ignavibacteriaceae bacterium]
MINLKMHLSRISIIEGIIFPLFIFSACSQPEKPDSYIARVNNSYLTEAEFIELVDSQSVSEKSRALVIKNWIRQEVLLQEAVKKGITETKEFNKTLEDSKRQLAASLVLQDIAASSQPVVTTEEMKNYYKENQTSFRIPFNAYYFNRINFSNRETAVMFRTELMKVGWTEALNKFSGEPALVNFENEVLVSEQDIYPVKLLRLLEGLYPLEISIVIPDDRGYYTVAQLLDKYPAQAIPPFEAVKSEVERRYKAALTELALENYINELYSLSEIEIIK